jgi:xylulokinase
VKADLLLGLDLGTTRCKALLLGAAGTEVAVTMARTPFVSTGGRIEMPVAAFMREISGLLAALGGDRSRIAGVGIAGIAECGAPLNASGTPLAPIISWHDPRGGDVVERLETIFGEEIGLRTGQRPRPVSTVAKLGWLVEHGCKGVTRWLGVPELCLWSLTASQATEHSLASRTGCYDVIDRGWMDPVARAAGFSTSVFPPVGQAGTIMGRISPEAATRWGLPRGIPVTIAGHDHLVGAVGAGAALGDLVNSVGTAETVLGSVGTAPDLAAALALRTPVSVAPAGQAWVLLAGAARSGVILAAASRVLQRPIHELDAMAARLPHDAGPVDASALLEPLQNGVRVSMPAGSKGAIWRGLLRALAARTAEATDRVAALAPGDRMLIIGGGSRSEPWIQAKTELIDLPIVRPRTSQAAARGAAIFAGIAAGWWPGTGTAPRPSLREDERNVR